MFADTDCTATNVFHCRNSTRCFDLKYRCDGSADCTYGDDETGCGEYDIAITVSNTIICTSSSLCIQCTTQLATHGRIYTFVSFTVSTFRVYKFSFQIINPAMGYCGRRN